MTDLRDFITARLTEDEDLARAANGEGALAEVCGDPISTHHSRAVADHAARHDPARVLREATAKRRVLARHHPDEEPLRKGCKRRPRSCEGCGWEYGDIDNRVNDINDCPELRDLAAVWSDHPDYNPAWRAA